MVPDYRDKDTLVRLLEKHGSLDKVAKECFCSSSAIAKWMKRYGLKSGRRYGKKPIQITINGETRSLREWAKIAGLDRSLVYRRYKNGVTGEELIKRHRVKKENQELPNV